MKLSLPIFGLSKAQVAVGLLLAFAGTGIAALTAGDKSHLPATVSEEGTVIYSNAFASESDFNSCTVIKGESNTSNNQWKYYKYGPNIQYSIYMSDSGEADSYLFIPNVAFDSTKSYTIAVDALNDANNNDYKAVLEFGYADAASADSYTLVSDVTLETSQYSTVSSEKFTPDASAKYAVLRVHFSKPAGVTAGYMGLKAKNLVITEFEGTVSGGGEGGDGPSVDTGSEIFSTAFDNESDFKSCTVIRGAENPTDNASEWKYYKYDPKYIRYNHYTSDNGTPDCYLFIPVSSLNPAKSYTIALDAKTDTGSGNPYDSAIEFGYANEASIDAYKAVNAVTVPFSKTFSTFTSDKFSPEAEAAYVVVRVHYTAPEGAKGSIETAIDNIVVTEFDGTVSGGGEGGDGPSVDTGSEIFSTAFDNESDFKNCTVIRGAENPTDNASEWKYYKYDPKYIRYNHYTSDKGTPDCYLFIPVSSLSPAKSYTIALDAKTDTGSGNPYDSAIEFGYANEASIDAYKAVNAVTVPFSSSFSTFTSDKFTPEAEAAYVVVRVHYTAPDGAKGSIETAIDNIVVTEFEGTVSGGGEGGDVPSVDTGSEIFSTAFDNESDFTNCTVIRGAENPTDNASEWKYYKYDPKYIRYNHYTSDKGTPDCYLFIPVSSLSPAKSYTIALDAKTDTGSGNPYDSAIEFGYANEASIDAYKAVNAVTVPFSKTFSTFTSDKFTPEAAAAYVVVRVHYTAPEGAKGSIETAIDNIVVTEFDGTVSGGGQGSDNPSVGEGRALPYSIVPTLDEIDDLTILDNNNDEDDHGTYVCGVWSYNPDEEYLYYLYSMTDDADDYVFLPLLYFDNAEKLYEIAVDAMVASYRNPEKLEICIGTSQDPKDLKVVYTSGMLVNDEEWERITVPVGIEKAGDYYVAIHAVSPKNDYRLLVKNISVKQLEGSPNVPQAPTSITAVAGAKGALNAEISFVMPSNNVAGGSLTGDVTVTLTSSVESTDVTAAPGESVKATVKTVQGNNNITLTAKNSDGEGNSAVVTVYTGVDKPCAPQPVAKVSKDNMSLIITWEQSETGLNGGYVDPATVEYTLFRYDSDAKDYDDGTVIKGVTTYEYKSEPGAPQHRESFLITAKNIAGQAEGGSTVSGIIGTPYELPMVETLTKGRLSYNPLSTEAPDESYSRYSDFRIYNLGTLFETEDPNYEGITDGHSNAIWGFIRYGEPGKCRFTFPKFSTLGIKEAKLKMNVFVNSIFPTVDVFATTFDGNPVKIGTISAEDGEGWTPFTFVLPETVGNADWVQVYLDTEITDVDNQNIFISSYSFTNLLESDLALESIIGTDEAISVGEAAEYVAVVRNEGKYAVSAPAVTFTLYKGEEVVETEKVAGSGTVQPDETAEYVYTIKGSVDNVGEYVLVAEIEDKDDNVANNTASIEVNVIIGLNPVVDDLEAVADKSTCTVTLTWSKPAIKLTGEDGFEDYKPFEYGKYIGNFKNVDLDGKKTYSYDQCVFEAATLPKAFMVINPEYLNNRLVQENYVPHRGDQYLVAFCPADGSKADDWLISPEVKPGTPVTFYVTTVALSDYSETYEICYSTTGNNPSDFKVLEKQTISGVKWVGKAVMLPEDAKYFAIHYTSSDVFGIMIDDITYTPVINEKSEFKYNVYSDGSLIASGVSETTYPVTGVSNYDSEYNVTAVVDGKEYAMSNTAVAKDNSSVGDIENSLRSIVTDGCNVIVKGYEGKHVSVFKADGSMVFTKSNAASVTTVTLVPGLYIVTADTDVRKIALY